MSEWRESLAVRRCVTALSILAAQLPGALTLFIEERIVFETDAPEEFPRTRGYVPDVAVVKTEHSPFAAHQTGEGNAMTVAEPVLIRFPAPPISEAYIEIRDAATGGQVITTIEFLSPSNKAPGLAQQAFLKQQADMRLGCVSLVEIDLIRGGDWVLALPLEVVRPELRSELRVSIVPGWQMNVSQFYPIALRQRLPVIPIPLRRSDPPLPLDLQALLDLCYDRGCYAGLLDYTAEPEPPLEPQNRPWADDLLRKSGQRPPN